MASTSTSGSTRKADDMEPFIGMASSPPPFDHKSTKKASYDVFINHRGKDFKSTVASVLYVMLTERRLSAFLDEKELEYGGFFPQALKAAMNSALVHIAIFSESYAESPWCLAELSYMLKTSSPVIPIFYNVDPSVLRWVDQGKGIYAQAFKEYEQKGRYLEHLQEWKTALKVVSNYKGEVINNGGEQNRKLRDIVDVVCQKTKIVSLPVADHPVGMEEIVEDFEKNTIQSVEGDQGVIIIGIWGMGGSGKTTLAKELYNKKSSLFKWSSFVSNVRDASTKGLLYESQKQILKDLGSQDTTFHNIEECKAILSRHLRSVKVFIVLDDVDHVDQLTALIPTKDRLESGSLIIVTTREHAVFKSWSITSIYKMKALNQIYAKQLFCWHAFKQPLPHDGFEELVEKFLEACCRLPISLKVIGGELKGELDKEYWESLLGYIITVVPNDIQKILKISYDNLDHQEKEMFLDVACFFIGEKSSLVIELWDGLGWSGLRGFKRLYNKCLVEYDDNNVISMHDHIRDLGRGIATSQSPYRFGLRQQTINVHQEEVVPSEGSPLWALAASICPCLMSALTTDFRNKIQNRIGIHGIIVTLDGVVGVPREEDEKKYDPRMLRTEMGEVDDFHIQCSDREFKVDTNCGIWSLSPFSVGLKYLVISGDTFNEVLGEVSRDLVWLRWFQIGQSNLPSGLLMKNLRVLEIFEDHTVDHPLEKLWVDSEAPVQLRHLLISDCEKFQGFPESIGRLNHLTKIVITKASNVTSLPDEFCHLKSLEHLVLLSGGLELLPINFGNLSSLRHLDLSQCGVLRRLPASFKNLMLLQHLDLSYCRELTSKSEEVLNCLQNITKLEYLNLCVCDQLEELPHHITNNVSLRQLYLGSPKLTSMPTSLGDLSSLTDLTIIFFDKLGCLPDSLGCLSSLVELNIQDCLKLEHLPDSLGCLSSLVELNIQLCPKLEHLPDSLGCLSSLVKLNIQFCPKLEHLPDSLGCLSSLTDLYIESCPNLEHLPDSLGCLSSLTNLHIESCPNPKHLPDSLGCLSSLKNLYIDSCPNLEHLPDSLGCLSSLTDLYIRSCPKLEHLPDSLRWLSSLTNLDIGGCPKLDHLPDSLGCLSSLVKLFIRDCQELEHLPDSLGCLTYLHIESCPNLEHLPDSLGCLTYLHIESCPNLEHLPDSLECLSSLTYHYIGSCPKLEHLPD